MNTYEKFEKEFQDNWDQYVKLNEELDKWRGKVLEDADLVIVNKLLNDIQDAFHKCWPTVNFVMQRYQFACKALHDYNVLLDQIKAHGAKPVEAHS